MRDCFSCRGEGVIDWGDEEPDTQQCNTCDGTGEVEDGCYCCAFCSCECCCGGWDGVECSCWNDEPVWMPEEEE